MSQPPRATRPDDVVGETTDIVPFGRQRHADERPARTDHPTRRRHLSSQDHRFQQADPHEVDQRVRTPESHPFPVKLPSQPIRRGSSQPGVLFWGTELAMTTKRFFCLLLASTAIGGTIALPTFAQTPATPVAPAGADGARRHRQHHAATARRAMARQHHHAHHHARPAGADAARCRDHGGDPHAPPARRRAGHRLGHHHRGHRPREHAGRARPGAQRARRHGRQQSVPRRLPELPDPRHRRQPRAPDGRRHAHARLPRFQPSAPAPTRASSPTSRTSSASRSSAAPRRRSTAPTRSAAWSPTRPRTPATT